LVPIEVLIDMRPPHMLTGEWLDNRTVLSVRPLRHHSSGVIFEDRPQSHRSYQPKRH
jgi:hypothetical protein